jgi:hypothetical protein
LRRLGRERARLGAVILLAVVALSASGVQSAAALVLQNTLNANWRGAYDVLVTAKGATVGTDGLLAPNSLGVGTDGMTLTQLAEVRKIPGIEVAAPIGQVITPLEDQQPTISLPMSAVNATSVPQAFRFSLSFVSDDGISKRFVAGFTEYVIIDQLPQVEKPVQVACNFNGFDVDIKKYPLLCQGIQPSLYSEVTVTDDGGSQSSYGQGATIAKGVMYFNDSLVGAPSSSTRITLIDPVAERKLLGKAGAFLAPLERIAPAAHLSRKAMDAWAKSTKATYASDYLTQQEAQQAAESDGTDAPSPEFLKELAAFDKEHHVKAQSSNDTGSYIPILTANQADAPLSETLTVQALGAAPRITTDSGFPYALNTSATAHDIGTTSADASALLNPFLRKPLVLPWPGTTVDPSYGPSSYATLSVMAAGSLDGSQISAKKQKDGSATATLAPSGYVAPIPAAGADTGVDPFLLTADPTQAGVEAAYSLVTPIPQPQNSGGAAAVPIGSFPLNQLGSLQSALSYVPLGAYQPISSTVSTKSGVRTLKPSVSGLGLVSPATVAIASIDSAAAWAQTAPVNSIRVRVDGISAYNKAAEQKVLDDATAIRRLGFTATVVAGSSPTDVQVKVSGYAFGVSDPAQKQKVGSLGTVTQRWSELGAAARADTAISTATLSILGIALGSTALLLGAVQFVLVPRRRAQAAVMREIGWTRGRIRRWIVAEEVPPVVLVLVAGVAAILLSGVGRVAVTVASIGVGVVLLTSLAAVLTASASNLRPRKVPTGNVGRRRLIVRGKSITGFGIRQTRIHLLTTTILFVANLIVAASAAGLLELFLTGRQMAGASLIGQFTTAQASIPQIVLGVTGLGAGVVLAVLTRRIDLARRTPSWEAMRAMGWTATDLRRAQRAEAVTGASPAFLLAVVLCGGGAFLLRVTPYWIYAVAGGAASLLTSIAILLVRRKASKS